MNSACGQAPAREPPSEATDEPAASLGRRLPWRGLAERNRPGEPGPGLDRVVARVARPADADVERQGLASGPNGAHEYGLGLAVGEVLVVKDLADRPHHPVV